MAGKVVIKIPGTTTDYGYKIDEAHEVHVIYRHPDYTPREPGRPPKIDYGELVALYCQWNYSTRKGGPWQFARQWMGTKEEDQTKAAAEQLRRALIKWHEIHD